MNHKYESYLGWMYMTNSMKIFERNVIISHSLVPIMQKGRISITRSMSESDVDRPFCSDHGSALPRQIEIQGIVGISKNLQNYLKNHFGDAWKQKTMAYFISSRINPIFGTVEFKKWNNSEIDHKTFSFVFESVSKILFGQGFFSSLIQGSTDDVNL